MNVIFVYYSFEGTIRELSKRMAEAVGADLAELTPVEEKIPKKGLMKYVWGGKASAMAETPPLQPLEQDFTRYDTVFLGTPVWAWNMSPPIRSFILSAEWRGKTVFPFCSYRGGRGVTLGKMRDLLIGRGAKVLPGRTFWDLRIGDAETRKLEAAQWAAGELAKLSD